jgi:hypothetical protein
MPIKSKPLSSAKELPLAVIKQMLTLATSGFGLVAALAWNELVKSVIETYIKPYLPKASGVISLLIYAVIITTLAVLVTLQLTKLQQKLTTEDQPKTKNK